MKIQKSSLANKKKYVVTLLVVILLCAIGYSAYAKINNMWPFVPRDSESANSDNAPLQSDNTTSSGSQDTPNDNTPTHRPSSKTPVSNEPTDTPTPSGELRANITRVNQTETTLEIGTLIEEVTSSGTCTISLSRGEEAISPQTVGIQPMASSSTCKGFSITKNGLSSGTWNIVIDITTGDKKARLTRTVVLS